MPAPLFLYGKLYAGQILFEQISGKYFAAEQPVTNDQRVGAELFFVEN
jgi:hypothetical protein